MLGSANITGGKLFHVLTGNLSHQIEHHLFPDMPARRYPEIAPEVRAIAEKYGLEYNTGSLTRQLGSVWLKIAKLALPDRFTGVKKDEAKRLSLKRAHEEALQARAEEQAREALARKRAEQQTVTDDSTADPEGQRVLETV